MLDNLKKRSKFNGCTLHSNAEQASVYVANTIADLIIEKQRIGTPAVLGFATGNTPKRVYQELVRLHQNEGLSFHNVVSFNLDEYYPILPQDDQSYTYFMHQYLFSHININLENIHIPRADCSKDGIHQYCVEYEKKIAELGGLDFQLLGIGRNGHIGFNEPGSNFDSITRLVDLHDLTREDAKLDFGAIENVPRQAISIGINTIVQAKKIVLLALGERKSEIIGKALNGEITTEIPASILQTLSHVEYVLDHEAASLIRDY